MFLGGAILPLFSLFLVATTVWGAEPCQKFLDGLRERGLYDVAIDYLDSMRASRLAPQDFRDVIDYEKAVTILAALRNRPITADRQRQLDMAQEALKKFVREHPQHLLVSGANAQLADVLVERGRLSVEQAMRPGKPAGEKAKLLGEARATYAEAERVFVESEQRFDAEQKKFPKGALEAAQSQARDVARRNLLHARLSLAGVTYETAQTYEPGSAENRKQLRAAAEKYNALFKNYQSYLVAYYARIGEARCYKELGEMKQAIDALVEPLEQADESEPFREMKSRATLLAVQVQIGAKNYADAAVKGEAWLKTARDADRLSEEGLAIKYFTGLAGLETARELKPSDAKRTETLASARRLLSEAADHSGQYQAAAKSKLEDPLLGVRDASGKTLAEPTNFAEALARGQEAVDRLQQIEGRQKEAGPERTEAEMAQARRDAFKYFLLAMRMRTRATSLEDVNQVRYYLAYLYWVNDEIYKAAVIGDFLARYYPTSSGARPAARIALAAYVRLFAAIPAGQPRDFEQDRLLRIAELITTNWPNQPEADEAWMMLIRSAVVSGELDKAVGYLERIPPSSARRGEAELLAGQALWAGYLRAMQLPDDQRPKPDVLEKKLAEAAKTLQDGIGRVKTAIEGGGEPTVTLVNAMLSLAQIAIETNKSAEAVSLLEDPKCGPFTLALAGNPLVGPQTGLGVEVYKAALRAFVGTKQLDKAEGAMKSLDAMVRQRGDAESSRNLTQIYIRLGRELQDQMDRLRKEGKTDELAKVSQGFELFLAQISGRDAGNSFHSLSWVAETFYSLGSGHDPGLKDLPPAAKNYYDKAAAAYGKILERAKSDPSFAPNPESVASVRVRLARCMRRLGQYSESLDLLTEVLKERATFIDAQVEAAYTYQSWGDKKAGYYLLAIQGGRSYKKANGQEENLAWGWGKISNMVARSVEFASLFFEARYNIAMCRLKYALVLSGEDRASKLREAERDVLVVQILYPEVGGPEWYAKFDSLLRKIQQLRGVPVNGLRGAKTPGVPENPSAAAASK